MATINVTCNLSNCTSTPAAPFSVTTGVPITITVTANIGYDFSNSTPTMMIRDEFGRPIQKVLTLSGDKMRATLNLTPAADWKKFTLDADATAKEVIGAKIALNLTSCAPEEEVPEKSPYNEPFSITLIAAEEHEFTTPPTMRGYDEYGRPLPSAVEMTISTDKKTATGTIDVLDGWKKIEVSGEALPVQVVGGEYGSINVYVVDDNSLKEFSKKRFITADVNGEEIAYKEFDLGTLVNRIKRVYVDVPIFSDDVLRCGNFNTGINVKQPEASKITVDFGAVLVPSHNKNTLDYDSEVNVFLPFNGFVKIPTDYVGKSIGLVYDVNIVTGDGVAKFTYDDIPFQVEKISPSSNVIYRTGYENGVSVVGSDTWDEMLYYGLEPFVYLKWFDGMNNGRNNDSKIDYIKSFKGFNIFADVSPISSTEMTVEEQQTIIRLLESGVYIE